MTKVTCSRRSSGFTLIELMVVIVIIVLLVALLLPAIAGALRSARNATVSSEMSALAQALADFRSKYSAYPPSRILLSEAGTYTTDAATQTYARGATDLTDGALAARSVQWLRRLWPRVQLGVGTLANPPIAPTIAGPLGFYDFNGNGKADGPYVLTGDECLVFFLGGIPTRATVQGSPSYGVNGFHRNPINPFVAPTVYVGGVPKYTFGNRLAPLYDFKTSRLVDLDDDGMPSLADPLGAGKPYAYFSAYGSGGYDPGDVDFPAEASDEGVAPITLQFRVAFPVRGGGNVAQSAAPNPYTTTATTATPVAWEAPQTYQILSAGADGLYGVGGQYVARADAPLPYDAAASTPASEPGLRARERDNLTSWSGQRLD